MAKSAKKPATLQPASAVGTKRDRSPPRPQGGVRRLLLLGALAILGFVPYLPTLRNELLLWDDAPYVTHNYRIQQFRAENVVDLFRLRPQRGQMPNGQYTPLVELSYMLEHRLFGLSPWIYHLDNALLHALNVLLVFFFARRLTAKASWAWLAAMFFAVHPLHVESVAWATERKDVLSAFFYLLALICHLRGRDGLRFGAGAALAAGAAAFLSKPLAVTLPAACLLCDYYRQGRVERNGLLRLAPLWALSVAGIWITFYTHVATNVAKSHEVLALGSNLLVAARGIALYAEKFVWPFGLSAFYPVPETGQPFGPSYYWALAGLAAILGGVVWLAVRGRGRMVVFGILFFLVVLSPSSRIVPVGVRFLAADRFFYLPGIGLFLILAEGLGRGLQGPGKARWGALGLAAGLGLLWAGATWQRSRVWFDDETLWRDALAKYPESSNILGNLAQGLLDRKPEEAGRYADRALAIAPGDGQTMLAKAILAQRAGKFDESLEWLDKAVSLDASPTAVADLRGKIYARQGEYKKAILSYGAIVEIEPQSLVHYGLMAMASLALGDEDGALECLREMERLDAKMAEQARIMRQFVPEYSSLSSLRQRMVLIPGLMQHQYELAQNCQFEQKDNERALREYRLLLAHYPGVVDFWMNASQHIPPQVNMPQEVDIRKNHVRKLAVAFYNQACLLALTGELAEADAALRRAFRYDPSLEESAATDPDLVALREPTGF